MNYVMSDIHGEYEKFLEMLEEISFKDDDNLYILGNIIDVGEEPIELLREIADRPNVYPIMGNCEQTAIDALTMLCEDIESGKADDLRPETVKAISEWSEQGGRTTLEGFVKLSDEEKRDILDYLCDFSKFEIAECGDKMFILVHRGLGDFDNKGMKLRKYSVIDLAFTDVDYNRNYFGDENTVIVSGHVPTYKLCGEDRIFLSNNNICINCGVSEGRKLGCLCLDTMAEYYI